MTCSLQTYRTRIGTFQNRRLNLKPKKFKISNSQQHSKHYFLIFLILLYSGLIVNASSLQQLSSSWIPSTNTGSTFTTGSGCSDQLHSLVWDPGIKLKTAIHVETENIYPWVRHLDHWRTRDDPLRALGSTSSSTFSWLNIKQRNKITHMISGNRGQRGKGINCVYWNKGPAFLCNKQLDIESIIDTHKPHILGLGEANFHHDHDALDVQQTDYNLHLDSCIDNPDLGMARVAVYTHNSLKVQRRSDLEDSEVSAVWLECGLPNQKRILFCAGYRQWRLLGQKDNSSASTAEQLARWLRFLEVWEKALEEDKEVIVTLDANLDFLTWRSDNLPQHHSSVKLKSLIDALFDKIFPLGVTQLVTGATRLERGQPRAGLDHLYTNKPDKLSSIQTYFTGMSDHKLIKFTRFSKSFKQKPRFIRKRMFKNFDDDQFRQELAGCQLEEILDCTDVNEAAELLVSKMNRILDIMAPVRTIQCRSKYAPWLSEETKNLQNERNAAQETAAQSDSPEDWRMFRSLRNLVTSRSRADKTDWEKEKLNDKENTPTEIWSRVKSWLGWGGGGTPTQIFSDGKMVSSPAGLASCMNKFFLDKIKRLRNSIPAVLTDPLSKMKEAMRGRMCTFKLQAVSVEDVLKIIGSLKNSSATGVDYIDTRTIKLSAELIAPALTHIINLSITTNTFPSIWKYAKVIPLLKSADSDPLLPKSYRPVALLPVLSKILEKIVFSQLVKYLEDNDLIHPNLHGSRSGHNTATALVQLYDRWAEEIDDGKMVGVLVCDQSAAFDLCDHTLLLEKLKLMGLEDTAAEWVGSYLAGRKQSCFVDGYLSSPLDLLNCGVPRGSFGGPLLWLCFTCDQPDMIHEHPVDGQDLHRGCVAGQELVPVEPGGQGDCGALVGYVDDGAYSYAHSDPAVLSQVLTRKYNLLEDWISGNNLVINPDKTHLMVMGPKKIAVRRTQVSIQAGTFTITPTETETLLGCHLHQSVQWNHHVRDGKKSLMKQLTGRNNGLKKRDFLPSLT